MFQNRFFTAPIRDTTMSIYTYVKFRGKMMAARQACMVRHSVEMISTYYT